MPEDVGGTPFPDGREPDDDHDRGGADDAFASVVFDEDFVRAAEFHEPTAVERLLAAAEARRAHGPGAPGEDDPDAYDPGHHGDRTGYGTRYVFGTGAFGRSAPGNRDAHEADDIEETPGRRGSSRWHRPVAWLLALVMGVGMVALAFAAVYRGGGSGRQDPTPPPATTGVDQAPSASTASSQQPVPLRPRLP